MKRRRQDLKPLAYIRSGSIYCMRRDFIIEKNKGMEEVIVGHIFCHQTEL